MNQYLKEELTKLSSDPESKDILSTVTPNEIMLAVYNACGRALKVDNGKEAVWLLSNRFAIEANWNYNYIVRESLGILLTRWILI
jgi:hypothetical protein